MAQAADADLEAYLTMEKRHYAALVARSSYDTEAFTTSNQDELVVGTYALHETFAYEQWLIGGLRRLPGAVAIDYGCGPGRMLIRLAPFFARVDGVDISPELIEVAARRCANLPAPPRLYVTPGDSLPADTHAVYDFAFSVICLQHICVHSIRARILQGLFDALKPGGVLSFQMGYGPGHANMVDYESDYVEAAATNGVNDVGVLHPSDLAGDLARVGFTRLAFALTPTGPGDRHGAWIFARAVKPGAGALLADTDPAYWRPYGFAPMTADDATAWEVRRNQRQHGVLGRRRQLHHKVNELERALADLRTASAHR